MSIRLNKAFRTNDNKRKGINQLEENLRSKVIDS